MGGMPRPSAGLEDVIDMSSSLLVCQFSSPLLCKRCKALAVILDKPGYKMLYFNHLQQDSFGQFPQLERLANAGSQFCAFLLSCLLTKIRNRPFSHELLHSSDISVQVGIKN